MERSFSKQHSRAARALTILCLALSLLLFATGATAWLSRNRKIASQDMTLHAETSANLVVAASSAAVCSANILTQADNPFAISLNKSTNGLTAATHDGNYATGLKYIKNTEALDRITGLAVDGAELTYDNAVVNTHYISYTFYIAAAGANLSNVDFTAAISDPTASTVNNTYKALSVDIYADFDASDGTSLSYMGTLNVAGYSYTNNGAAAASVNLLSDGTIYQNTTGHYITVELRVYFDGNLLIPAGQSGAGNTYLTAANLDTTVKTLGLSFTAAAHTGS